MQGIKVTSVQDADVDPEKNYHSSSCNAHRGNLGPLHTRAKSYDYEIVRAQQKVCKGHPKTPSKSCSVGGDPQVWCEVICD